MTEAVQIALIAATPPSLIGGAALIVAITGKKQLGDAVKEVHLSVNSRLTQLLEATSRASHADGIIEGQKVQKETDATP